MRSRSEIVAALEALVKERPGLTTNELVSALDESGFEIPLNGNGTLSRRKANTVGSRLNGLAQQDKIWSHKRAGKNENYWYHRDREPKSKLVASLGSYQTAESAIGAIEDYPDDIVDIPPEPVRKTIKVKVDSPAPEAPIPLPERVSTGMVRLTMEVRAEHATLVSQLLRLLADEFETAEAVTEP